MTEVLNVPLNLYDPATHCKPQLRESHKASMVKYLLKKRKDENFNQKQRERSMAYYNDNKKIISQRRKEYYIKKNEAKKDQ